MSTSATLQPPVDPGDAPPPTPDRADRRGSGLFAAFWRWHFYASFVVLPIMAVLAVTGLVYLFRFSIDPVFFPQMRVAEAAPGDAGAGAQATLERQEAAVLAQFPDATVSMVVEGTGARASRFSIDEGDTYVYVDPRTGEVTGSLSPTRLPSDLAVRIHGTLMAGRWGDYIIEAAACWAIVMALTGYFLYLRGRKARARVARKPGSGFPVRSWHAVTGAVAGVGILFLVVSGLPWTAFWGEQVQKIAGPGGWSLWGEDPGAESSPPPLGESLEAASGSSGPVGWTLAEVPGAGSSESSSQRIDIDAAVAAAEREGLSGPFSILYPDGPTAAWAVMASAWDDPGQAAFSDVSREATVHVDQYSGEVVARYGYGDYSAAARVVSQSIALHEGRRFGTLTTVTTTAFCLGVLFLCVSAPIMWWRRRPSGGGLAAPRARMLARVSPWLLAPLAVLAVLLPLFGLTLVVALLVDGLLIRRVPALRRAFAAA